LVKNGKLLLGDLTEKEGQKILKELIKDDQVVALLNNSEGGV
jgi:hypothetical protein